MRRNKPGIPESNLKSKQHHLNPALTDVDEFKKQIPTPFAPRLHPIKGNFIDDGFSLSRFDTDEPSSTSEEGKPPVHTTLFKESPRSETIESPFSPSPFQPA